MKNNYDSVFYATSRAYADCDNSIPSGEAMRLRDLHFRALFPVTRDEAVKIMEKCVGGYNEFEARLLKKLPEDAQVTLAREGSVCIYVKGKLPESLKEAMKEDEFDYNPSTGETRIWWD